MNARTFEERAKFDHGLTIGTHRIDLTHKGQIKRALVSISPRGIVRILTKPDESDMYSSWRRLKGDVFTDVENVVVWGARNPDYMAQFEGEPAATIPVKID